MDPNHRQITSEVKMERAAAAADINQSTYSAELSAACAVSLTSDKPRNAPCLDRLHKQWRNVTEQNYHTERRKYKMTMRIHIQQMAA